MTRLAANSLLLLAALIWGGGFIAQATAMQKIGPLAFIGARFLVAALVLLPFALAERKTAGAASGSAGGGAVRILALVALAFLAAQTVQQFGIVHTSVTNVGFLTTLYVVMVPVLAIALYGEWPHLAVWPAAALAMVGTWLLTGGIDGIRVGDLLAVVCAFFWALHVVFVGRAVAVTGRPVSVVFVQCLATGLAAGVAAYALEAVEIAALAAAWPEILFAGAVSGGLAFALQAIGQRRTRAADAAIILSAEAPFAALFAAVLLGERVDPAGWGGVVAIFAAVLAVQLAPVRGSRRRVRVAEPLL
ncbi:DMT family transporter [Faunimonas sp. B44]|uniref:DMT family transporter n=1 Tax=Faunimonas sp. B44 TaxID=3461493 RepID=UPI0040439638